MKSSWVRRPITGLGVFFLAIALTVTLPLWAILTMVVDAVRGRWRFPIPRLIAFATCWAWLETSGLAVALFLFFTKRGRSVSAHYALQTWWCRSLIQALGFTVGLQITVEGAEHVGTGPFVALGRHASLAAPGGHRLGQARTVSSHLKYPVGSDCACFFLLAR